MRDAATHSIRLALVNVGLTLGLLLGGCASVYRIDNHVQSFPGWGQGGAVVVPSAPQHYRFERLPSQREGVLADAQDALETIARTTLARVGWNLSEAPAPWTVQVSADTLKLPRAPWENAWDDVGPPFGLLGGNGYWGTSWLLRMEQPYYERQVSLLIRQVGTGLVVYETRARHDGRWASSPALWEAMLNAALHDFPNPPMGQRQVNIDLPR